MRIIEKLQGLQAICRYQNPVSLFIQRLLLSASGLAVYRVMGMTILADHRACDQGGISDCFLSDQYTELIRQMELPQRLRVVDLGANIGSFSLMIRSMQFSFDHLTAVEMNPQTFSRMQFNLLRNLEFQPNCMCAAVSSDSGFVNLENIPGSKGQSVLQQTSGDALVIKVPKVTLEEIIPEGQIDLCKIDIEGAEYDLFSAGFPAPLQRCRHLIMEIHEIPGYDSQALVSCITGAGYHELHKSSSSVDTYVHAFSRKT